MLHQGWFLMRQSQKKNARELGGEAERLRDALTRIARDAERPAKEGRAGCRTMEGSMRKPQKKNAPRVRGDSRGGVEDQPGEGSVLVGLLREVSRPGAVARA